ncbi:MAG TPA: hypothetical protein VHH11_06790 [Gammaproteobacteria bacterium]|jgi:hypothetical protein|nr:hypothetical protein [Gammaproteobacteria bacterium]
MLKFLKRWLGWDADATPFDFSELRDRQPPLTPTLGNTAGTPSPPKQKAAPSTPAAPPRRDTRKNRDPLDVLDNPRLTLDKPTDDGFDPYNTGAFNRSKSWDKIGRQRKR